MVFLLVWFLILQPLGFGCVKLCCSLPLVFLEQGWGEEFEHQKHCRQCVSCLAPCMVWFEGRKGTAGVQLSNSGNFCGLFSSTHKL